MGISSCTASRFRRDRGFSNATARTLGLRRAWVLALIPLFASCALVNRNVQLDYSAPPREEAPPAAGSTAPKLNVAIGKIIDNRVDPVRVGEVRNGFGMHTADVCAQGDGAAWVRDALVVELERAGLAVVESPTTADLVVDAELRSVHCTAYLSYAGDITLTASARRWGQRVVGRVYSGKGGVGLNWTGTEKSFEATLDLALQDAVIQFIQELRATPSMTTAWSSRAP